MNLTNEHLQAAEKSPVAVEVEGKQYILISKVGYERVQNLICYEEMDPSEAYPAVLKARDSQGAPEDEEAYKDYGRRP